MRYSRRCVTSLHASHQVQSTTFHVGFFASSFKSHVAVLLCSRALCAAARPFTVRHCISDLNNQYLPAPGLHDDNFGWVHSAIRTIALRAARVNPYAVKKKLPHPEMDLKLESTWAPFISLSRPGLRTSSK
ncbi:hypothetical protein BD626DRAFT_486754 [Schizophyllum amplum]|uniref:Uncharacterized protein n=1 Tax=Schizophyllum amplum TaxID=97359 RepID=A0A550CMT4_9AGAR|nr:hypothetical protein BD626DRAFT_486754 [Auriculariopsis ampla]